MSQLITSIESRSNFRPAPNIPMSIELPPPIQKVVTPIERIFRWIYIILVIAGLSGGPALMYPYISANTRIGGMLFCAVVLGGAAAMFLDMPLKTWLPMCFKSVRKAHEDYRSALMKRAEEVSRLTTPATEKARSSTFPLLELTQANIGYKIFATWRRGQSFHDIKNEMVIITLTQKGNRNLIWFPESYYAEKVQDGKSYAIIQWGFPSPIGVKAIIETPDIEGLSSALTRS